LSDGLVMVMVLIAVVVVVVAGGKYITFG